MFFLFCLILKKHLAVHVTIPVSFVLHYLFGMFETYIYMARVILWGFNIQWSTGYSSLSTTFWHTIWQKLFARYSFFLTPHLYLSHFLKKRILVTFPTRAHTDMWVVFYRYQRTLYLDSYGSQQVAIVEILRHSTLKTCSIISLPAGEVWNNFCTYEIFWSLSLFLHPYMAVFFALHFHPLKTRTKW